MKTCKFVTTKATKQDSQVLDAIHEVVRLSMRSIQYTKLNSFVANWTQSMGVIKERSIWKDIVPEYLEWQHLNCCGAIRTIAYCVEHLNRDLSSVFPSTHNLYVGKRQMNLIVPRDEHGIDAICKYFTEVHPFTKDEITFGRNFISAIFTDWSWLFDSRGFPQNVQYGMPGLALLPSDELLKSVAQLACVWDFLDVSIIHMVTEILVRLVLGLLDLYYTLALPEVSHPTFYSVCKFSDYSNKDSVFYTDSLNHWLSLLEGMTIMRV